MDKNEILDLIFNELLWFEAYAEREIETLRKVRKLIDWWRREDRSGCPFDAEEAKKIAENLCEIASFRYGGDMELFKTSADYRRGRLAAMGNLSGYTLAEIIAKLFEISEEITLLEDPRDEFQA